MSELRITVDGPFSLAAAASFGFGPGTGRPYPTDGMMRLAFVSDDLSHHVGAVIRQDGDGSLVAELAGPADDPAAEQQIRRILSLDVHGRRMGRRRARRSRARCYPGRLSRPAAGPVPFPV